MKVDRVEPKPVALQLGGKEKSSPFKYSMISRFFFRLKARSSIRSPWLAGLVLAGTIVQSQATDYSWNATGSSNTWETSTNWLPNGTPGSLDSIVTPTNYGRLNLSSNKSVSSMIVNAASNWNIAPLSTAGAVSLTVGTFTKSGLTISFSRASVGPMSVQMGAMTVNGGGVTFGAGDGTLGTVSVSGSTSLMDGSLTLQGGTGASISFAGGIDISTSSTTTIQLNGTTTDGQVSAAYLSGGFNSTNSKIIGGTDVQTVTSTLNLTGDAGTFLAKTYSGQISNGGSSRVTAIHKTGSMTQIFQGVNTYSGGTIVSAGTLLVNNSSGSGTGTGTVSVASGATFGGGNAAGTTGLVGGLVSLNSGGHLAPGVNDLGRLTLQSGLTLNSTGGSILDMELGTTSDLLRISAGTFTGNSSGLTLVNISAAAGFGLGTYTLIDWTGATASGVTASDFQLNAVPSGYTGSFNVVGSTLQLTVTAIPEPSCMLLCGLGLTALLIRFRRAR